MNDIPATLVDGYEFIFTAPGHEPLWQRLEEREPLKTASLTQSLWLGELDFLVEMLGEKYLFNTVGRRVVGPTSRLEPDRRVILSLLNYLSGTNSTGLTNRLVPEKVLPGGGCFFSGTHALSRKPIIEAFGRDGASLLNLASRLGAKVIDSLSGAFSFKLLLLPKIPVQVTLSEEDEEFPAELYFAFDSSAASYVPLGIISALVGLLNDQLAAWK
jgi:hypothetical protein